MLAILGSNGSGKTTLIKMLTTLTRASSGEARVCGLDVATQGAAVRTHIGLVGQYAAVDEVLTARANLAMFGRLHGLTVRTAEERGAELLEHFDLEEAADKVVAKYSGGMRRRIDLVLEEADTLADDVVILREGTVVASGTAAELKALSGEPRMVMQEPTLDGVYRRLHTDHDASTKEKR